MLNNIGGNFVSKLVRDARKWEMILTLVENDR